MGVVYEAYDHELQCRVALKTLRQLTPDTLARFKREFRSLQGVHHPNLVRLGELISTGDEWFFTMELVEGDDFLAFVRPADPRRQSLMQVSPKISSSNRDNLETAPTARFGRNIEAVDAGDAESVRFDDERLRASLRQLGEALAKLHEEGIVHRDVKPSNIRVDENTGRVVLLDFGLVANLDSGASSSDHRVVGTPAYMAPEQAEDGGRRTGGRSLLHRRCPLRSADRATPVRRERDRDPRRQAAPGRPARERAGERGCPGPRRALHAAPAKRPFEAPDRREARARDAEPHRALEDDAAAHVALGAAVRRARRRARPARKSARRGPLGADRFRPRSRGVGGRQELPRPALPGRAREGREHVHPDGALLRARGRSLQGLRRRHRLAHPLPHAPAERRGARALADEARAARAGLPGAPTRRPRSRRSRRRRSPDGPARAPRPGVRGARAICSYASRRATP